MILIAHRGNLHGPSKEENSVYAATKALWAGYDVELDVHLIDDKFYIGHDVATEEVTKEFITQNGVWCHAKTIGTLQALLEIRSHCFYHVADEVTLTSRGYLWTYPGKKIYRSSISVMPEKSEEKYWSIGTPAGICSDYVGEIR